MDKEAAFEKAKTLSKVDPIGGPEPPPWYPEHNRKPLTPELLFATVEKWHDELASVEIPKGTLETTNPDPNFRMELREDVVAPSLPIEVLREMNPDLKDTAYDNHYFIPGGFELREQTPEEIAMTKAIHEELGWKPRIKSY